MITRALVLAVVGISLLSPAISSAQIAIDPSGTTVTVTSARPITRSARRAITAVIPEVRIKDQPLGTVMDKLKEVSGANMIVDWKALEAAGISRDTVINISLYEISLGTAIDLVLREAQPKTPVLTYIDTNVIHVTTQTVADSKLITRAYNVRDLTSANIHQLLPQGSLGQTNNNNRQQLQNNQTGTPGVNRVNTSTQLGTNQQNQNQNYNQNNNNQNNQTTSQQVLQVEKQAGADLVNLVKMSVRPDIWKDDTGGGGPASITFYNGMLVVSAPLYVHEQIGGPVPGH